MTSLIGRAHRTLANNPELRYTPSGRPVASFTLDVETEQLLDLRIPGPVINSFPVTAWGKLGELCNRFLRDGSWIYVQGGVVTEKTLITTTIHSRNKFGDYDEEDIKYFARLVGEEDRILQKELCKRCRSVSCEAAQQGGFTRQHCTTANSPRGKSCLVWHY